MMISMLETWTCWHGRETILINGHEGSVVYAANLFRETAPTKIIPIFSLLGYVFEVIWHCKFLDKWDSHEWYHGFMASESTLHASDGCFFRPLVWSTLTAITRERLRAILSWSSFMRPIRRIRADGYELWPILWLISPSSVLLRGLANIPYVWEKKNLLRKFQCLSNDLMDTKWLLLKCTWLVVNIVCRYMYGRNT